LATDRSVITNCWATAAFERPFAIRAGTSRSRGLSGGDLRAVRLEHPGETVPEEEEDVRFRRSGGRPPVCPRHGRSRWGPEPRV
jgi:hypothetical protein